MDVNTGDFAAMFGDVAADVDYSAASKDGHGSLPLPLPTDSLEATARKLEALAQVVEKGQSLAVATGVKRAIRDERDLKMLVRAAMTSQEALQFDGWMSGVRMPAFDWAKNVQAVPAEAGGEAYFEERAAAMREIWAHADVTAENASWLASNMHYAVPLVEAVVKARGIAREQRRYQNVWSEMEVAELYVSQEVVAVASENVKRVSCRLNELARGINRAKEILQGRERQIMAKDSRYGKREDPVDKKKGTGGLASDGTS